MPATLILQTAAPFTNVTGGLENIGPITYTGTIIPFNQAVTLASGSNTLAVPTPASGTLLGLLVILPPTGGVTVQYKEVLGDTGIYIPETNATPFLRFFDQAHLPTSIYLVAGSAISSPTTIWWF
jgi:hypothetical protein